MKSNATWTARMRVVSYEKGYLQVVLPVSETVAVDEPDTSIQVPASAIKEFTEDYGPVPDVPVPHGPILPPGPMNRLIDEGYIGPDCEDCKSNLHRRWIHFFRASKQSDGCINPECKNYYDPRPPNRFHNKRMFRPRPVRRCSMRGR